MAETGYFRHRQAPASPTDPMAAVRSLAQYVGAELQRVQLATVTKIRTVTVDTQAVGTDAVLLVDATAGAVAVLLMQARVVTFPLTVKKIDVSANAVTVTAFGTETIDGGATYSLAAQGNGVTVVSDHSNYFVTSFV